MTRLLTRLLFCAAFLTGIGYGQSATVTSTADSGAGSLREAIANIVSGGTISFNIPTNDPGYNATTGIYTIALSTLGDDTFGPSALLINKGVTIDGGSSRITLSRDAAAQPAKLRLFYVAPTGNLTLRHLTLSGGLAKGGNSGSGGGGLGAGGALVNAGTLNLDACLLVGNQARGGNASNIFFNGGGGMEGDGVNANTNGGGPNGGIGNGAAGGFGGGGALGSTAAGGGGKGGFGGGGGPANGDPGGIGGFGGGGGNANSVAGAGGFAAGNGVAASLAGGGAGLGGAIFNYGGAVILTNSTLTGNTAQGGTGGNPGSGLGGAVFNLNGTTTSTNVTIANNIAPQGGGGIYNLGDNGVATQAGPTLTATTLANPAQVTLTSTIVAGSTDGTNAVSDYLQSTYDSGAGGGAGFVASGGVNNLVQNAAANFHGGANEADPMLAALADNGGPTKTIALLAGSPCINGGPLDFDPNSFDPPLTTDQRGAGFPRVQQGTVDIGAFELDAATTAPTLTAPATDFATKSPITVTFTLPEAAQSGSVKLAFTRHDGGGNLRTLTLAASMESAGTHTFTFDPANVVASSSGAVVSSSPNTTIFDTIWDVTLSYSDASGNPAATATNTNVTIDTVTLTPASLGSPMTDGKIGGPFVSSSVASSLLIQLPEDAMPGSVIFTFDDGTTQYVLTTSTSAPMRKGLNQILFKSSDPVGASRLLFNGATVNLVAFASMTNGSSFPDGGPYSVSFTYQDKVGNSAVQSNVATNVTFDTVTQIPTLTQPGANSIGRADVSVKFTLPEDAASGTLTLRFSSGGQNTDFVLADSVGTAGTHSFTFDATNPTATAEIASGNPLPDGTYSVLLSYRDSVLNTAATATHSNVTIDTKPPTFNPSFSPLIVYAGTPIADYRSQAGASDENGLFLGGIAGAQTPPVGTVLTAGTQQVTISQSDNAGNSGSVSFDLAVRPANASSDVKLFSGQPAPGAGTNGLPAAAKIASFQTPAIDEAGNISFVAKWTGDGKTKGTGLFSGNACLAIAGGDASALAGAATAKFKSFTDPVADRGNVACIGTFSGVPVNVGSAVLSNLASGGALESIARAGDVAPIGDGSQPAGGVKFKSFKAVALHAGSLGIFAQLASGTTAKATPADDLALFIKDGTGPLRLILREGNAIEVATNDTRTIKTMVSFAPGDGSPGAGRGWLAQPYASAVLALVTFTDKSQALVSMSQAGSTIVFSSTGAAGSGGPAITDATFASYSFPATNDHYTVAFLGSMTAGLGGVAKADARGVFLSDGTGTYTPLARLTQQAGNTGATFSVLKDPVLAEDDGVAFTATLKGGNLKPPATASLWTKRGQGALGLLAQGGADAADLPGAKWKAFTSLAIAANRGPIFVATLVPNKTNVSKASASGVWACDFLGNPRLLFRTGVLGALVQERTLKKFTLLSATVGSTGVSRSFNDAAQVVWLATFKEDKSQAIVTTEIP